MANVQPKYFYVDARDGTKYATHTCTDADEEDRMCGAAYRYTIMEGGDHTQCSTRTLGVGPMGSGRGNG